MISSFLNGRRLVYLVDNSNRYTDGAEAEPHNAKWQAIQTAWSALLFFRELNLRFPTSH